MANITTAAAINSMIIPKIARKRAHRAVALKLVFVTGSIAREKKVFDCSI
jgi:hypothetical protein